MAVPNVTAHSDLNTYPSQREGLKAHVLKPGQLITTHIFWALFEAELIKTCPHCRPAP